MTDLAALFRAEGITVRVIGNPAAHVRPGTFAPVGVLVHHTGSKGTGEQGLDILVNGRDLGQPDELRGPLCTASPRQNGTLDYISAGRANHAGAGSSVVLDRMRRDLPPLGLARDHGLVDDITGNGYLYGFEVDNSGAAGDDYPLSQIDCTVRTCTAVCRHHGWTANRVALHSEWTRRKVDWSLPAAPLRAAVAHRLAHTHLVRGLWVFTDTPVSPPVTPPPSPAPIPVQEDDMQALMKTATDPSVFITDGVSKRHVTSQAELQVLIAAGLVKPDIAKVAPEILAAIPTVHA